MHISLRQTQGMLFGPQESVEAQGDSRLKLHTIFRTDLMPVRFFFQRLEVLFRNGLIGINLERALEM